MRAAFILLAFLTFLLPASSRAAGPIVAVFEMEDKGSGLTPKVLGNLSDYLGVLLTKGGYRVVPRTEIRDRLKAQKKESYKSCYDQSCQIELGRELAAEKTLATWILKIGKTCQVTATLYDLKKGTTERAAAHEAACNEEDLLVAVKAIADDLCNVLGIDGASAEEAAITAALAKKEAEAAREEARRKAVELEKMRREAEAAKKRAQEAEAARRAASIKVAELEKMRREAEVTRKRADEAEAARLAAMKKVEELEKAYRTADKKELEQARREAVLARERAEKAEAAKQDALKKAGDLEFAQKEAKLAKERAELAERERKLAEAARLEAEKKAEEARREAEEAKKHPEGHPTESYNIGIKLSAIAPDITEMKIDHHDLGKRTGEFEGGFGVIVNADFMVASFLSIGAHLAYGQGEYYDPDDPNEENEYLTMHMMSVFASLKGRFNLGWVEFRPGIAGGYHHLNGSAAGKVNGLGLAAFVETAFYLGRHFALTVDLGMNIMPVASGSEGDQTYTIPLFMLSLGAEYCD